MRVSLVFCSFSLQDLAGSHVFEPILGGCCFKPSKKLRKGLSVDIANAMASEASDKTKILNSIRLPRAGTKVLQQEAQAAHESNSFELLIASVTSSFTIRSHVS